MRIEHYNLVIKTECLYASERLRMTPNAGLQVAERSREKSFTINGRKVRILWTIFQDRWQTIRGTYIFKTLDDRHNISDEWLKEVEKITWRVQKKDSERIELNWEDISYCTKYRSRIDNFTSFPDTEEWMDGGKNTDWQRKEYY